MKGNRILAAMAWAKYQISGTQIWTLINLGDLRLESPSFLNSGPHPHSVHQRHSLKPHTASSCDHRACSKPTKGENTHCSLCRGEPTH